jgi:hypothetical protein
MLSVPRGQPPIYTFGVVFVGVLGHPACIRVDRARLAQLALEARGRRPPRWQGRG